MANRFDDLTVSEVTSLTLLSRAKQGDSVAMEALMGRYLVRLQRWAHGRLPLTAGTLLDTDDVVQRLLADALVANGELARAVAALDSASTPPGLLTTGDQEWLLARERLAALYAACGTARRWRHSCARQWPSRMTTSRSSADSPPLRFAEV